MLRLIQALAATLLLGSAATAGDRKVVVELFTSQGCSSCPPADEMMQVLADRDDVIALSLHVDYWDYIGWKDAFADPRHAKRQRGYAQVAGRRSIYTPQMIVNGMTDIVGAKPMQLAMAIEHHGAEPATVDLRLSRTGEKLHIEARAVDAGLPPLNVHMLRYQPERLADIKRGENAGKTIPYVNVVQDWRDLGDWSGESDLVLEVQAPGELPIVVMIQKADFGPILAVQRLKAP